MFAISVAPVKVALLALCHLVTLPVLPVKFNAATVPPEQILWLELTEPPTLEGVTVIINGALVESGQVPLFTTAL